MRRWSLQRRLIQSHTAAHGSSPVLEVGGTRVPDDQILFSGLAPEFVGLYQVNFRLPAGIRAGASVPIVIRVGDIVSRADVTIAIE